MNTADSTPESPDPIEYWRPILDKLPTLGYVSCRISDPAERNSQFICTLKNGKTEECAASYFMRLYGFTHEVLEVFAKPAHPQVLKPSNAVIPINVHMQRVMQLAMSSRQTVLVEDTALKNPTALVSSGLYKKISAQVPLYDTLENLPTTSAPAYDDPSPSDNVS